jgi:uncharacterized protein YrrD
MFSNKKFQIFVDEYSKIADDKLAENALKDFMFSLSPDEFCTFMVESGRYFNEAVILRLSDPTCSSDEKQMYKAQVDSLFELMNQQTPVLSKAA